MVMMGHIPVVCTLGHFVKGLISCSFFYFNRTSNSTIAVVLGGCIGEATAPFVVSLFMAAYGASAFPACIAVLIACLVVTYLGLHLYLKYTPVVHFEQVNEKIVSRQSTPRKYAGRGMINQNNNHFNNTELDFDFDCDHEHRSMGIAEMNEVEDDGEVSNTQQTSSGTGATSPLSINTGNEKVNFSPIQPSRPTRPPLPIKRTIHNNSNNSNIQLENNNNLFELTPLIRS